MTMKRRDFLSAVGAGAGSLALARLADGQRLGQPHSPVDAAAPARLERIGLELYAVRNAMKANPEKTLAAVRAIGYTDVELLWSFKNFGQSTKEVRDTLKREGLKAPSAHMAPETILSDWEQSLATAKTLGHQYLIVPSLPAETNRSLDAWKLWASRFNVAGEVARRYGIWLAFHNEPNHQKKLQGQVPIEVFADAIDPKVVRLQLDCGNMLMGGGDPMDFLSRHRANCWSFHLKNVVADTSSDTELAKGTFDLRAFLAAVPELAKKPCFVEQEGAGDELLSAKENFAYVSGLRW
jgi:sugar phosphate isomerase/epimerase